ncbi:MAG: beta-lactamase family protein [Clostridia bacterium]|nr:beta-lactamase family protein [Clostridia bacterium]
MKYLNPSRLRANIEERMAKDLEENNVSGVSLIVKQNGSTVYSSCFGTTVPGGDIPVTPDTLFRMASMTKPITGVAVMRLVEQGKLRLDDDVERYLPQFSNMRVAILDENGNVTGSVPAQNKIKILHLLTHTSGLGSKECAVYYLARMTDADRRTLQDSVNYFATTCLLFDPFTNQAYSGLMGFDVLAAIVEKITGEDYLTHLKRVLFDPLGMVNTTFTPSEEQWARLITMHNKVDGKSVVGHTVPGCVFHSYPASTRYGGGSGLISNVEDYIKFAEMLRLGGSYGGVQILKPETVAQMATPHVPASIQPGKQRWGLSMRVIVSEEYQRLPVGAFGWSGAHGTHFWIDPVNGITAVYLKNSHFDGGSGATTSRHFEKDVAAALED